MENIIVHYVNQRKLISPSKLFLNSPFQRELNIPFIKRKYIKEKEFPFLIRKGFTSFMVPLKFPPLIKESKINIKISNKINKSIDKDTNMDYNKNIEIL